jgi:hypothetical protein
MSRTDFIRDYTPPTREPAIAQLRAVEGVTIKARSLGEPVPAGAPRG